MLDFNQLSPLMRELHTQCVQLYYLLLPVFFALALALQWFRRAQGTVDFIDILKRTIVSTLLLVAFPEISDAIIAVSDGIAARIDSVQGLTQFMTTAQMKAQGYSNAQSSLLIHFNDMFLSAMTFLSFLILYVMRYLSLAMFHFFWFFYVTTAPLLLLFNVFAGTSQITANLFRGMIEVASWKIVWAILGVMLASLSFGKMYAVEGSYITIIVMNFVIAIAMIGTPALVRSLIGGGMHSMSPILGASTVGAIVMLPARAAAFGRIASNFVPPASWMKSNESPNDPGKRGFRALENKA